MYVYVDTAALIALAHKRDHLHKETVDVYRQLLNKNVRLLTTDAVLLEVGNAFSHSSHKPLALSLLRLVRNSSSWQVLPIDNEWFSKGIDLFAKRIDKDWSLTDCIGIAVADAYKIKRAFTSDHHFRQAGFDILL